MECKFDNLWDILVYYNYFLNIIDDNYVTLYEGIYPFNEEVSPYILKQYGIPVEKYTSKYYALNPYYRSNLSLEYFLISSIGNDCYINKLKWENNLLKGVLPKRPDRGEFLKQD